MSKGTITGKEVLNGVKEEIAATDEAMKKLLATYNSLYGSAQKFNSLNQGSGINTTVIETNNKINTTLEKRNSLLTKSRTIRSTNLAQIKSLNSTYLQQSRLLTKLRNDYKSLEVKKQLGISLTKKEQVEYAKLRKRVIELNSALTKTDAAAGQFQRNVGNYPKGMASAVGALRSFAGAFGFTSGIFLFASALKNSYNRVKEFDSSMQNLAGIMRTSRDDISDVEKEIIKVAGSSVKTSREVANLAESLATLGKTKEEIKDLLEPVNNLSIALEANSDETGEFLVQTLNAFGASSDSAAEYANTIAAIRTSTTLDFQKMRDSFQYITPISRLLGKDLEYTGAIVGVLADNSIKAEQAGRLLGTAQIKLATAGLTLEQALEQINQAYRDGKDEIEILAIAGDLFGKQAAKIGAILAKNTDTLEEYEAKIRGAGGALDYLVNEQLKSLDSKVKILDSSWEELVLTIENGNGQIADSFKDFIGFLTTTIQLATDLENAQSKVYEATGASKGFLDYLQAGLPYLKVFKSEYEELIDIQRDFNKVNENIDANGIIILEEMYSNLNDEIENNNDLSDKQIKLYKAQLANIGAAIDRKREERKSLEETAILYGFNEKELGKYSDKIQDYTDKQLRDFLKANKQMILSLEELNDAFDGVQTIAKLEDKLKALKETFKGTEIDTPEFYKLRDEIKELESEISRLYGKTSKTIKRYTEGTIGYYEALISKEREIQKSTAKTADEYQDSEKKIREYQKAIDAIKTSFESLSKVDTKPLDIITQSDIDKAKNRFKEAVSIFSGFEDLFDVEKNRDLLDDSSSKALEELEKVNNGWKTSVEFRKQLIQDQANFSSRVMGELFGTFSSYYGLDLSAFHDLIEGKKGLEIDYAATVNSVVGAIYDSKISKYDDELEKHSDILDIILNDETASEEKKAQAQIEYNRKEAEIENKKAKAKRDAILFQISVDTAQSVAKSLLNAASLASNPITAPFAANAYAQAAIAGALGAAQAALVMNTPLPQFFMGKDGNNDFEGLATWGERRREVLVNKYGDIEVSPNRTTPKFINKDDIIIPSMSEFNRQIKNPDSDIHKRISNRLGSDMSERNKWLSVNNSLDIKPLKGIIEREIKNGFKNVVIQSSNNAPRRKPSRYHV